MPPDSSFSGSSESSLCSLPSSASGSGGPGGGGNTGGGGGSGQAPRGNKAILKALTQAEQTNLVALLPQHAILTERCITATRLAEQTERITEARQRSGEGVGGTVTTRESTQSEGAARFDLQLTVNEICTAAYQKFSRSNRTHLRNYRPHERWETLGRALFIQYTLDIINVGAADNLPGIPPEKIARGRARHAAYINSNVNQTTAQGGATGKRISLKALMKLITDFRVETKLAAEAEWPHTDPANAAIRKEFGLPAKKMFRA